MIGRKNPIMWKENAKGYVQDVKRYWQIYLLILPALAFVILFAYVPMYGIQIAFKDFNPALGITGSPWSGLKHFQKFISSPSFWRLIKNTVLLNVIQLLVCFPAAIIFAVMLNELGNQKFKRVVQMVTYAPYFISVVAMVGIIQFFLKYDGGVINNVLELIGMQKKDFLTDPGAFRAIYVISDLWQHVGWNAIIYIAALSSIDPQLVESAIIDGASRLQKIWYVDIPGIMGTIVIMFILKMGSMLSIGFDKIFLLQNDLIMETSDVISTYVYRIGLVGGQFSYTTAIGVFNSIVNFVILISVNKVAKKVSGSGIW